jgi:hypothetical protein
MEAYSAPAGYVFSLNAGGRSGDFDVVAGAAPVVDTLNGIYIALANGNHAKRRYFGKAYADWFGISNDGTDIAQSITTALGVVKHIVLTAGSAYGVSGAGLPSGISMPSNSTLEWEKGASIQVINGNAPGYRTINISSVEKVTLINPVIVGDRDDNTATGEQGNLIYIVNGASGCRIYGGNVSKAFGDGVFVGGTSPVTDLKIYNLESRNNRRQGMSVTNANGLRAINCGFYDINGTAPEYGVDIEPNNATDVLKDIKFINCRAGGNSSNVGFGLANINQDNFVDIEFVNCTTTDSFRIQTSGGKGIIKFTGCNSFESSGVGFEVKVSSINVTGDVTVIDPNRGGSATPNSGNSAGAYFLVPVANVDIDLTVTEVIELVNPILAAFVNSSSGVTDCKVRVNTNLPRARSINILGLPTSLDLSVSGDREFDYAGNVSPGNIVRDNLIRYTIMTNETRAFGQNHVFGAESDFEGNFLGFKSYRDETCKIQLATNTTEGFNRYVATAAGAFIKFKYSRGVWQIIDRIGTWTGSVV